MSTVPVDVLTEEVACAIRAKYTNTRKMHLANNASINGIAYSKVMVVARGSVGGLALFAEVIQKCIINENLLFIVKVLLGWYNEHYRAFELNLSPSREVKLLALSELTNTYPLAAYMVGCNCIVTLKRHILLKGWLIN